MPRESGCPAEPGLQQLQQQGGGNSKPVLNGKPHSFLDCCADQAVLIKRVPSELSCAQRLRELGIIEGAQVTVIRCADPVLLLVKDSRIAIDRQTAALIEVEHEL